MTMQNKVENTHLEAIDLYNKDKYEISFLSILTYIGSDDFKDATDEVKNYSYMILDNAARKCKKKDVVTPLILTIRHLRGLIYEAA